MMIFSLSKYEIYFSLIFKVNNLKRKKEKQCNVVTKMEIKVPKFIFRKHKFWNI